MGSIRRPKHDVRMLLLYGKGEPGASATGVRSLRSLTLPARQAGTGDGGWGEDQSGRRQQGGVEPIALDGLQHLDEAGELLGLLDVGVGAGGVHLVDVLVAARGGEDD